MLKLPVIKAKNLLKAVQKAGFYKFHQSGSHIQMKNKAGRRGTLRGIINDMNLTVEEFIRLLKK